MLLDKTLRLVTAFSVVILSACERTDQNEPAGGDIRQRDAGMLDAMPSDGSQPSLDAVVASDAVIARDADPGASQALAARVAALTTSRARWRELSTASPGPYWYAEENCGRPSLQGSRSTIQVASNVARVTETTALRSCGGRVNRSKDIRPGAWWEPDPNGDVPETMEQLYDVCESTLRRIPLALLQFDARGVIQACYGDEPGCADGCGAGFYLRDWQFGIAPPTPDAGVAVDSGVRDSGVLDSGMATDAGS